MQRSKEWMLKVVAEMIAVGESKFNYVKRVEEARIGRWREKVLYYKFLGEALGVADGRSWQRLRAGYLVKTTTIYNSGIETRLFRKTIEVRDVARHC